MLIIEIRAGRELKEIGQGPVTDLKANTNGEESIGTGNMNIHEEIDTGRMLNVHLLDIEQNTLSQIIRFLVIDQVLTVVIE